MLSKFFEFCESFDCVKMCNNEEILRNRKKLCAIGRIATITYSTIVCYCVQIMKYKRQCNKDLDDQLMNSYWWAIFILQNVGIWVKYLNISIIFCQLQNYMVVLFNYIAISSTSQIVPGNKFQLHVPLSSYDSLPYKHGQGKGQSVQNIV